MSTQLKKRRAAFAAGALAIALTATALMAAPASAIESTYGLHHFEVTSVSVDNVSINETAMRAIAVRITYTTDDPNFELYPDDAVYLATAGTPSPGKKVLLRKSSPGVITGTAYFNNDTPVGVWWAEKLSLSIQWDDSDYVSYVDNYVAYFNVKRVTKLTLNASPEPVKKGNAITVTGSLKRIDGGVVGNFYDSTFVPYASKDVRLYFDPSGSDPVVFGGTVKTNSKGVYSKKFTAKRDGTWYATFAGTSGNASSASARDYVDVK